MISAGALFFEALVTRQLELHCFLHSCSFSLFGSFLSESYKRIKRSVVSISERLLMRYCPLMDMLCALIDIRFVINSQINLCQFIWEAGELQRITWWPALYWVCDRSYLLSLDSYVITNYSNPVRECHLSWYHGFCYNQQFLFKPNLAWVLLFVSMMATLNYRQVHHPCVISWVKEIFVHLKKALIWIPILLARK